MIVASPAERTERRLPDRRREAREEHPARREHPPHLADHRPPVRLVAREVQHGARHHDVHRTVVERHRLHALDAEVVVADIRR
jgi:hypothetical protein